MGPWMPGDDTFIPTPTTAAGYIISSPWVDQKIRVTGAAVLTVKGNVENPLSLTMINLQGFPQKTSTWINTANASKSFTGTGPELNALINAANPKSGATSIKLISSDGSTYTMSLSDLRSDPNAIVSFVGDGSLRSLIPTQSAGKAQLRGLIVIEVI
jgi:DMSO/TMAO reductase YedYZ molybdopterin-dependent catalytic subunit